MLYLVYVYNCIAKFHDVYMVRANNNMDAAIKAQERLDAETNEGSKAYFIDEVVPYYG